MLVKIKSMIEIENSCICKDGSLVDKTDSKISFLPHMRKYCGEETEVLKETKRGIYLKIDAGKSLWPFHWLRIVK